MSRENAEVVSRQFEALESGGVDAAAELWCRDIDWRAVEGAPDDVGVMTGHAALRRYYEDWFEMFDRLHAEVEEILFDDEDRVAAVVHHGGLGRASGVPTQGRYYVVCTIRDGQIASGREYATREDAIRVVSA
jgi:ketosteroid isomerase-like protein